MQLRYNAAGSENELDTQLEILKVVKMPETERLEVIQEQVTGTIIIRRGLIRAVKTKS